MEQRQPSQMHETVLRTLRNQKSLRVDETSLSPVIEGRYRSLFTVNTDQGKANVQVRMHSTSMQISLDVISSNTHLSFA